MIIVKISNGKEVECETEKEVLDAIGNRPLWSTYTVEATAGEDISEYIPF